MLVQHICRSRSSRQPRAGVLAIGVRSRSARTAGSISRYRRVFIFLVTADRTLFYFSLRLRASSEAQLQRLRRPPTLAGPGPRRWPAVTSHPATNPNLKVSVKGPGSEQSGGPADPSQRPGGPRRRVPGIAAPNGRRKRRCRVGRVAQRRRLPRAPHHVREGATRAEASADALPPVLPRHAPAPRPPPATAGLTMDLALPSDSELRAALVGGTPGCREEGGIAQEHRGGREGGGRGGTESLSSTDSTIIAATHPISPQPCKGGGGNGAQAVVLAAAAASAVAAAQHIYTGNNTATSDCVSSESLRHSTVSGSARAGQVDPGGAHCAAAARQRVDSTSSLKPVGGCQ